MTTRQRSQLVSLLAVLFILGSARVELIEASELEQNAVKSADKDAQEQARPGPVTQEAAQDTTPLHNKQDQLQPQDQDVMASMMSGHSMMGSAGDMVQQGMQKKQQFIQRGMQAKQQLLGAVQGSMHGARMRSFGRMENMAGMMDTAQKSMMKGGQEIKQQLTKSLQGHMSRMQGMQGIGENMMGSVQRVTRTLSEGVSQTVNQLQQTGQKVTQQIRGDLKKNTHMMSNMMGSMQGSMSNMGSSMQKNLMGLMGGMQGAVGQIGSQLSKVAQAPMQLIEKVSQIKSNMMMGGGGGGHSSGGGGGGGRY